MRGTPALARVRGGRRIDAERGIAPVSNRSLAHGSGGGQRRDATANEGARTPALDGDWKRRSGGNRAHSRGRLPHRDALERTVVANRSDDQAWPLQVQPR